MKPIRGCLTVIGAIVVIIIVVAIVVSSGGSNKKAGQTNSPALVTGHHSSHKKHKKVAAKPQTFKGNGSQNIGTIAVPVDSTLHWSCPTCANDNFIVGNSFNDDSMIDVNADGPTTGKTVVDAGAYHDVEITTEGQAWTIRIVPGT